MKTATNHTKSNMPSSDRHSVGDKIFANEATAREYAIANATDSGAFVKHVKSGNCVACYYSGSTR